MAHDTILRQTPEDFSKKRLTGLMLACIALASAELVRSAYIQVLTHPRLENMARRQFQANALVRPRRGPILDRTGEPLAINLEVNSLAANPLKMRNRRRVAKLLSRSTDIPYARLFEKLSEKKEFVWIKRHLSEAEMRNFKKWRLMDAEGDLINGLWLVKESDRIYPHGHLASHIMGDVNVDSEGLEGVELWMNDRLRGKVVSVTAIKDALGRPTFIDAVAAKNVRDGESVALTIDASLQFEVEQHLSNAIHKTGARGGSVIVMNATNGEILALANEPSFSPGEKNIPAERRRNRALTDGYEPGSTLKAVLAASALSNGWKLMDQVWGEKGSFLVQNHRISEAEAHEKFEWVSLKKMIQVSSNVAAAKVALQLGADKYLRTLKSFGFGEKTGLGFPGEITGRLPLRRDWRPLTLANIGFGQGILVTPIQMIKAYAVFANGGLLVQPKLLKKTRSEAIYTSDYSSSHSSGRADLRVISSKVSHEVVEALTTVTEEGGTGMKATLPGYRIAGKTGTAQMVDPKTGQYSREKYIASFIGFPVDVEPKIVILTTVVEPRGIYYASETAAPLFREVLNSVANHVGLPTQAAPPKLALDPHLKGPRLPSLFKDSLRFSRAAFIIPEELKFKRLPNTYGKVRSWIMPSLKGLSPREAFRILKGHPFQLVVLGVGVISSQVPEEGKEVAEGDKIRLILSEP